MDLHCPDPLPRYCGNHLGITALERGIRLSEVIKLQSNYSDSVIWSNSFYTFVYYLRYWAVDEDI